jgi:hypothetical protein
MDLALHHKTYLENLSGTNFQGSLFEVKRMDALNNLYA